MSKLTTEEIYRRCPDLKPGQIYPGDRNSKMIFVCPSHGLYKQSLHSHFTGHRGCARCGGSGIKKFTTEEIYRRWSDLKPGQRYRGCKFKMIFICPIHGPYRQTVDGHSAGRRCQRCHYEFQKPGKPHTFPCGCSGILPPRRKSNKFAIWGPSKFGFRCRVFSNLHTGSTVAKERGYKFNAEMIPHSVIREMMEKHCWRCGGSLDWTILGRATTPHLHHDHETGEILGFTHPKCNPRLVEMNNDELKQQNRELSNIAELFENDVEAEFGCEVEP